MIKKMFEWSKRFKETGHLRAPGAAVVDRGHPEEQDGRDREDRCADPGREVIRDDDEHQAGQQGQRSHRQVQPAAKVGLDGRDDRIDALFEGVRVPVPEDSVSGSAGMVSTIPTVA